MRNINYDVDNIKCGISFNFYLSNKSKNNPPGISNIWEFKMSEIEREHVKLTEEMLMELIRGKKLTLQFWGKYEINIIPPKYGVTLNYDEWQEILNEFMPCSSKSFDLIHKIQSKF